MRKVIKILLTVVSSLILATIILPLVLTALLGVPAVQNAVVDVLTAQVTKRTGIEMDIEKVRIRGYNRVEADGIFVADKRGDTMLYVQHAKANLNKAAIAKGKIVVGDVYAEGALVNVYMIKPEEGLSNIKETLGEPGETNEDFTLDINDITLVDSRFVYNDTIRYYDVVGGGINWMAMDFQHMDAKSDHIRMRGDSLSMELHNISFVDKSGVVADYVGAGDFSLSDSNLYFSELKVRSGNADLYLPRLALLADDWHQYQNFMDSVRIEGVSVGSRLDMTTLSNFVPTMWTQIPIELSDLSLTVGGTVNDFEGEIENVVVNDMASLSTNFSAVDIEQLADARLALDGLSLQSEGSAVCDLYAEISGKRLSSEAATIIRRLGVVGVGATVSGLLSDLQGRVALNTSAGALEVNADVAAPRGEYDAHVVARSVDLGRLLAKENLGKVSLVGDAKSGRADGDTTANLLLDISELDFNNHKFSDIALDANYEKRLVELSLNSRDSAALLTIDGQVNLNGSAPRYDARLKVERADLHEIGLVADSVSLFAGNMYGRVTGRTLEEMSGDISFADLSYTSSRDTVTTESITVVGHSAEGAAELKLESDIIDINLSGPVSYREVVNYFGDTLWRYLPSLSPAESGVGEQQLLAVAEEEEAMPADAAVRIEVGDADAVAGIFVPGLQIAPKTRLDFNFNPTTEQFNLQASSPYIEVGDVLVANMALSSRNLPDSMWISSSAEDLYVSGLHMPRFGLSGGAKQNHIDLVAGFEDNTTGLGARLGICSRLGRDEEGKATISANFEDSYINTLDRRWEVTSDSILYTPKSTFIENFALSAAEQSLLLDGIVSSLPTDTLHLDINNLDLSLFNPIIEESGYDLGGRIDGHADLMSVLNKMVVEAEMNFVEMSANEFVAPTLRFDSRMDFGAERVTLHLAEAESGKDLIDGYYRPADRAFLADVTIDRLPLALLDAALEGVASDNEGALSLDVEVANDSQNGLQLNGDVVVDELVTTVDFLGVRYSLPKATLALNNSRGRIRGAQLVDPEGNRGTLELELDMTDMQNLRYDVRLLPVDMLVLNTEQSYDAEFYGRIYASGAVIVEGNNLGTNMDIVATTSNNSNFYLPLSGTSEFSSTDFVTFVTPTVEEQTPDELTRRKERYTQSVNNSGVTNKDLNITMTLNVLPNLDFHLQLDPENNNELRATGNAALNLNINPSRDIFTMYGDYQISEGTLSLNLEDLIVREFSIQSGSTIDWSGSPLDATLNIDAAYRLKTSLAPLLNLGEDMAYNNTTVECIVTLSDRLSEPSISFDVRLPNASSEYQSLISSAFSTQEMMATQFIYLLAFGNFYSDTSSQNLNIGAQTGSMIGFDILSRQLSNLLSSEDVSFDFRYRPRGELNSDEVGVDIQKPLIGDRLVLELEANYDTGNNPTTSTDTRVSGGGSLTYTIDKAGNLILRGFSRTIDSFDENQGLQENGVGLYYGQNFDTFKELRERRRERRQERREAKAQSVQNEETE